MFGKKGKQRKPRLNSKGWPLFDPAEPEIPAFLAQSLALLQMKGN